ncbi:MAG: MFS transporter [Polaribacter sp.]|nr:MFS transporter [Polaribacter sp.]
MLALIIAGEAIFLLPFVLVRVFRPTILEVFQINNFELGTLFSIYGMIAMGSYFLGGPIADKFESRKLMAAALVLTALGGIFIATIPDLSNLKLIYGFWGMTTILLFWAALIKATREWGTKETQGMSFGFLEGGRGAFAAIIATFSVLIFSLFFTNEAESVSYLQKKEALQMIILFVVGIVLIIAIFVWFFLPKSIEKEPQETVKTATFTTVINILKKPTIWLQAIIIVCAYVAYKITDDFSLYAKEVLHYSDTEAASVGTLALWMRPVAAVTAGLIADKISSSKMIVYSFICISITSILIGFGLFEATAAAISVLIIIIMCVGIYALRGLYFAIMEEANIPLSQTGTAIGIISVVGYTPDIFIGPIMGYILDKNPGAIGHQNLFLFLAAFSCIGILAAIYFGKITRKNCFNSTKNH